MTWQVQGIISVTKMLLIAMLGVWSAAARGGSFRLVSARQEAVYLSKSLSQKVSVSSKLEEEILYISGAKDPQKELKAVAEALHASAVKTDDGISIERTEGDRRAAREALVAWRKDWIEKGLKAIEEDRKRETGAFSLSQAIKAAEEADDKDPHLSRIDKLMPARTLLTGLIREIGVEKLAGLDDGKSLIYETNPVLRAQPLLMSDDLISNYQSSLESLDGIPLTNRTSASQDLNLRILTRLTNGYIQPNRFRLQIRNDRGMLGCFIDVYTSDGELVDFSSLPLSPNPRIGTKPSLRPTPRRIPMSDQARAMRLSYFNVTKLEDWMTDPIHHEPLGCVQGLADEIGASSG